MLHLCVAAAQIWLKVTRRCSAQDFQLGLFHFSVPLCEWTLSFRQKKKQDESLVTSVDKTRVIQRVWKRRLLLGLLPSCGVPPHCVHARHIYLSYPVQRERGLYLLVCNESVMNQSGASEKPYIISLPIIFKFIMLALLQMIASDSASARGSLSYALAACDARGGLMGKFPALCLIGRKLSCWWKGKWVMMEACFEVDLSRVVSTTGSPR